jgi:DNA-directed RNA polymerase specialized sigma24 family protein
MPAEETAALAAARTALVDLAEALVNDHARLEGIRRSLPLPEFHIQVLVRESESGPEMYPALALADELEDIGGRLAALAAELRRMAAGPPPEPAPPQPTGSEAAGPAPPPEPGSRALALAPLARGALGAPASPPAEPSPAQAIESLAQGVVGAIAEFQRTFDGAFHKLLRAYGLAPPAAPLPEATGAAPPRDLGAGEARVAGAQPSRSEELVALLDSVRTSIRKVLGRFRVPSSDGEDLVQETCLLFLAREHELADPAAWFLATLGFRCRAYWHNRSRRERLVRPMAPDDLEFLAAPRPPEQERRALTAEVAVAVAALPPGGRALVLHRYAVGEAGIGPLLEAEKRELVDLLEAHAPRQPDGSARR